MQVNKMNFSPSTDKLSRRDNSRRSSPQKANKSSAINDKTIRFNDHKRGKSLETKLPKLKINKKRRRVQIALKSPKKTTGSFGSWDAEEIENDDFKFAAIQ